MIWNIYNQKNPKENYKIISKRILVKFENNIKIKNKNFLFTHYLYRK